MDPGGSPSVPLMIGCAVSCMALLTLLAIYAAFWRFIKSERSIILLNFCVSILASNVLILVGQSQMLSKMWECVSKFKKKKKELQMSGSVPVCSKARF